MMRLLSCVRVLECAVLPTGDQASRLLGDLGADVIKIERPGTGDYLRELGDRITPQNSVFHLLCNRNKRSIELDLRSDEGRAVFHDLLPSTDIFVDGFADGGRADLFDQLVAIFLERTQSEWLTLARVHVIPLCPGTRSPGLIRAPAGPRRSATSRSNCTGTRWPSVSTPRRSCPASVTPRSGSPRCARTG